MNDAPRLPVHEWLAVVVIIGFIFILALITRSPHKNLSEMPLESPHYLVDQHISVSIEGAVEHPGVYEIERTSSLGALLQQAKPLPEADIAKLSLERKLRNGQRIKVKFKKSKKHRGT